MAPLAEQVVDDLKQHIARLEGRIAELEGRISPSQSHAPSKPEGVRMILIGPPGAGKPLLYRRSSILLTGCNRKGNPGTQDQGEVLRLPSCTC